MLYFCQVYILLALKISVNILFFKLGFLFNVFGDTLPFKVLEKSFLIIKVIRGKPGPLC